MPSITGLGNFPEVGGGTSFTDSAGLASALSDETGSGLAVFGTAPTISSPVVTTSVEANTAGSASPNILLVSESFKTITNEGSSARNYHTLPTAAAGDIFTFIIQDTDGMRVTAAAGDTIRCGEYVTAVAGYIEGSIVGSWVTLEAINATEWIARATHGEWQLDGGSQWWLGGNFYRKDTTMGASVIVGSAAGQLNHASGVELAAAITGKRLNFVYAVSNYTFATAAYTGGGNLLLHWGSTSYPISSAVNSASTYGAATDTSAFLPASVNTTGAVKNPGVGANIMARAGAAYTQPGTAAGVGVISLFYTVGTM